MPMSTGHSEMLPKNVRNDGDDSSKPAAKKPRMDGQRDVAPLAGGVARYK